MNPAAFSVRNRALVNAAMILVIVVGVMSFFSIPRELTPKIGFNWAFILTSYSGANPEEVEKLVSIPIEDEMQSVDDLDVITSRSTRGNSFVWLRFEQISDDDFERRLDDVRARIAKVDLPDAAEDPYVEDFNSYDFQPVVSVVVRGSAPELELHRLAQDLAEDLRDIPGVDDVEPFGDRDRAVLVECDPHQLEAYGLDTTDVETALRLANLNLPAGAMKLGTEEVLLRTRSEFESAADIAEVTLRAGGEGSRVRISDLAKVTDGFEDREIQARFNGEPAISLAITKREDGNTLDIVEGVRDLVATWELQLPAGVTIDVTNDESVLIAKTLRILESNAAMGLVLVIVALFLFLGWRAALVAALGIPVTFLIAVIVMVWTGQTLNGSTLFGLILVLGMVVDDAVVVLENAFRHLEKGRERVDAVVFGVGQVVSPVVISSLTTMGGFLPLVFMPGTTGKFMRIVPIVVSVVLLASLIEALFILPSHFVDVVRVAPQSREPGSSWWEKAYMATLQRFLPARYFVVAGSVVLLAASTMLIPLIGIDLFAGDELSYFHVYVTMPDGTRLEKTDAVLLEFERRVRELPAGEVTGVTINAGLMQSDEEWQRFPHAGQLIVNVTEPEERSRSIDEILDDLRRRTADILGPVKVEFRKLTGGPPSEAPIQLMVKGSDLDQLAVVAGRVEEKLRSLPGVLDVRNDLSLTQRELDVVVDREAAARRGLDPTHVARAVRAAFGGSTATSFRQEDEEIDVIVRYPEEYRSRLQNVTSIRFATATGDMVPFTEVAELHDGLGPMTIRRHDYERQITIKANVDQEVTDIAIVNRQAFRYFDEIRSTFPGVRLEQGGQFQEFIDAFNALTVLFVVGLLINFMLMAGQFKNWLQPLLILAVVPLSFIGAMLGLLISREPFSITTLYGFVALAGVAVNDSIVLVDFINKAREHGHGPHESLIEAGRVRLRPILLTSVTTILGLLPMAIGLGGSSPVWRPLATTIAAGLAVATVISLLLIPCLQAIADDFVRLARRLFRRGESVAPAAAS